MRLIDGDAFVASINESIAEAHKWGASAQTDEIRIRAEQAIATFCEASLRSKQMPTIDAVPVVHGVWITKEYMYGDPDVGLEAMWIDRLAEATDYYAGCSVCGKNAGYDGEGNLILSDFCPSCGAKMRGSADNSYANSMSQPFDRTREDAEQY